MGMPDRPLSIVVVGAHMDDHWYGMGATMLKAARKGHKVTVVQSVSDYCAWPVVTGRGGEIKPVIEKLTTQTNVQVATLGYDYMIPQAGHLLTSQVAAVLRDVEADVLFCPWDEDHNPDHTAMAISAKAAGTHGASFLPRDRAVRLPKQIFQYALDAGNKSFRADRFVDTGSVLFDFLELNNVFDVIYSKSPLWPGQMRRCTVTDHHNSDRTATLNGQSEFIFSRSVVQGLQCGVRYADAFSTYRGAVAESDMLAII
jgi:hypothetical protein